MFRIFTFSWFECKLKESAFLSGPGGAAVLVEEIGSAVGINSTGSCSKVKYVKIVMI